jgi:hypothetical protein
MTARGVGASCAATLTCADVEMCARTLTFASTRTAGRRKVRTAKAESVRTAGFSVAGIRLDLSADKANNG